MDPANAAISVSSCTDARMKDIALTTPTSCPKTKVQPACLFFVDLFAGCGGLSLGLLSSGWRGLFAIEQSRDGFETLRHNLVDTKSHNRAKARFEWPAWLNIEPHEIRKFIKKHRSELRELVGSVQLVAGGPPCQGFSFAGRRTGKDPRNELFRLHLQIVDLVKPQVVLLENVQGIDTAFGAKEARKTKARGRPRKSYAGRIKEALCKHGYEVQQELVRAVDFGVPQFRPRYFTVGIRRGVFGSHRCPDFFEILRSIRANFLKSKGLSAHRFVTVAEAISDLETTGKEIVECVDSESASGFKEIVYRGPSSAYQRLMHGGMNGQAPNSLRLVNHRPETVCRFQKILRTCRKGVQLSDDCCFPLKIDPLFPGILTHPWAAKRLRYLLFFILPGTHELPHAVALALDEEGIAVVQKTVKDRRGDHIVLEDLAPVLEGLVAGNND